ncbi:MAG: response regulator transcription factor [Desulforhabdus sp.]|jgi:DNA-binding NarL/FixJ family response regulator|nr:response regulator transcription factor [Desulforhabdus sp.]
MLRTLIVEDNLIFRQSLKEMLRSRFPLMTIAEATDGVEALSKLESFDPTIVFMDIRLPGENGFAVTRKIRARDWTGIIIVLTSHELPEYRDAAYSSGANYFLTKGTVSGDQIASLIESIMCCGKDRQSRMEKSGKRDRYTN